MSVRLRSAPHRATAELPRVDRTTAAKAFEQLSAAGLDEVCSSDLEVYRLVLLPAEFKRLCNRLDTALAEHTRRTSWTEPELPFGTDVEAEVRRERSRRWGDRPNGEAFPLTWTVATECQLPGRMKLVVGREFTVRGVRGRLRFRHAVTTVDGEFWVEGWDTDGRCRSIDPARVRVVHAKSKVRPWHERLNR